MSKNMRVKSIFCAALQFFSLDDTVSLRLIVTLHPTPGTVYYSENMAPVICYIPLQSDI